MSRPAHEEQSMRITYDSEAGAAYIYVVDPIGAGEAVTQQHSITTPDPDGEIILDFDADGKLLGIEVLDAERVLRTDTLKAAGPPTEG